METNHGNSSPRKEDGFIPPRLYAAAAVHGHVVCASLPPASEEGFAVSALMLPSGAQAAYAPAVSRVSDPASWDGDFALYIGPEGTVCAFVGSFSDPVSRLDSGVVPPKGVWTHAALSYDGAEAVLYVDGAETARASVPDADPPAAPLAIGSLVAMGVTRPWNGALADVRLHAAPLAAAEVSILSSGTLTAWTSPSPGQTAEPGSAAAAAPASDGQTPPDSDGDGVPDDGEIRLGRDPYSPGAVASQTRILEVHTPME